ncbi:MAG: hypothetical protein ABI353_05650 [Isosphaeraceae bacterium]
MSSVIDEQTILDSLRQVPANRWGEVLRFLDELTDAGPAIRTGADLSQSGLVGSWTDREDLGRTREFAGSLRRQAETRRGADDAAGY